MKTWHIIILSLFTLTAADASVSIISTSVRGALDQNHVIVTSGTLGLVVVDTGNNGFGQLTPSAINTEDYVGDGDDWIAGRVTSQEAFGEIIYQVSSIPSFNISDSVPTAGPASQNDAFAFIWLPGLGASATSVSAGQSYGLIRPTDAQAAAASQEPWRIPADGSDVNGFDITAAGPASHTVNAIPEPSTLGLLALGAAGLMHPRRRR